MLVLRTHTIKENIKRNTIIHLINTYIIIALIIITIETIYIQTGPICKAVGQNYGGMRLLHDGIIRPDIVTMTTPYTDLYTVLAFHSLFKGELI